MRHIKSHISRFWMGLTKSSRNSPQSLLSFRARASKWPKVNSHTREGFMCWSWRLLNGEINASTLRWDSSTLMPIALLTSQRVLKRKMVYEIATTKAFVLSRVIISDYPRRTVVPQQETFSRWYRHSRKKERHNVRTETRSKTWAPTLIAWWCRWDRGLWKVMNKTEVI